MDVSYIPINTVYYLKLFVTDSNGNGKSGQSNTFSIYRSSDDVLITSGSLTDKGNGIYTSSYTFNALGQFYIIYETPDGFTDEIEGVYIDNEHAKQDELLRSLGLNDENKKIIDTVYDANSNLTSATVKLFPSATDFVNNTNVMATYEFTATYNAQNEMLTMGVKKV